jgi:hypothetical protein
MQTDKTAVISLIAALFLIVTPVVFGQNVKLPPDAPIPAEIATAKKVFISNAAGGSSLYPFPPAGGVDRCYNQLYAGMKEWGRYDLVAAPGDADLIFEMDSCIPIFRLVIMDHETHVALWSFSEPIQSATLATNREKNFDLAMASIMEDVKGLVVRAAPAGANGGH